VTRRSPSRRIAHEVRRHRAPEWWRDAKLGIFVHWTPASVPAFAPTSAEIGELIASRDPFALSHSPYSEWYENSLRFPDSPAARHHAATYGDRPYRSFARDWEAALADWRPDDWAARFAATGARYVVLVTKHHDGYCLWPTSVTNPHVERWHCERDVVGELAEAVRGAGMRFGVYYSGGLDSTWNPHPVGAFSDFLLALPRGAYSAYADAQVRELIERYRPSVLWNDISWPARSSSLARLLADYYAAVPDGVINDRFLCWSPAWSLAGTAPARRLIDAAVARAARKGQGTIPPKPRFFDVRTPEYAVFDDVQSTAWECVRGIDHSFGYNRESGEDDFLTREELLWSFVDIVAKGGNLLLNVGPRGEDATIADAQLRRLEWLASFTGANGAALFGTRPWTHAAETTDDGLDVRYTQRADDVFAFVRGSGVGRRDLVLTRVRGTPATRVTTLDDRVIPHRATDLGLVVELDAPLPPDEPASLRLQSVSAP
jgi:alpha-L-fucosidase